MSAFVVAHVTVKNPEKFKIYAGAAPATVAEFGGEVLIRGQAKSVLSGDHNHQATAIMRFPDQDAVKSWYASPSYQALIPNREEAADMVLISYDAPPAQ